MVSEIDEWAHRFVCWGSCGGALWMKGCTWWWLDLDSVMTLISGMNVVVPYLKIANCPKSHWKRIRISWLFLQFCDDRNSVSEGSDFISCHSPALQCLSNRWQHQPGMATVRSTLRRFETKEISVFSLVETLGNVNHDATWPSNSNARSSSKWCVERSGSKSNLSWKTVVYIIQYRCK